MFSQLVQMQQCAMCVQGFAKNLLDVADDLQRAAESVPPEVLKDGSKVQLEKALGLLKSLLQGVNITERNFLRVCYALCC